MINLWRCYALRHNAELLLDTDDSQILAHYRSANWMRWFTAQKYLRYYESLLIVDPDEYVAPECWDIDIIDVLRHRAAVTNASVVVREFFYPQTLNDGVVYIRNTPMGHFFLRLLLDKVGWWQTHAQDQGAFDETLLEMAGMEVANYYKHEHPLYTENCFPLTFPLHDRSHATSYYTLCWFRAMEMLIGEGGKRQSAHVHWMDPRVLDMNHVVGLRGMEPRAMIYHFAGKGKTFKNILNSFLGKVDDAITNNCKDVYAYVDSRRNIAGGCIPFNEGVIDASSYCTPPLTIC